MYNYIYNPINNQFTSILSLNGKYLLKKYIQSAGAEAPPPPPKLKKKNSYQNFNFESILYKHNDTILKNHDHLYRLLNNNELNPIYASLHGSDLGYGIGMEKIYSNIDSLKNAYIKVPDNLYVFHSYKMNCAAQTTREDEFKLKEMFINANWPIYTTNKCETSAGFNSHLYFPNEYIYNQALSFDSGDINFDIYELNNQTQHRPFDCSYLEHKNIPVKYKRQAFGQHFDLRYKKKQIVKGLYMSEFKKKQLELTNNFKKYGFESRVWDKDKRNDKFYTHSTMDIFLNYISSKTAELDTFGVKKYRIIYIVNCMPGFDNLADESKTIFYELNNIKRILSGIGMSNFSNLRQLITKKGISVENNRSILTKRNLFCSPEDDAGKTRAANTLLKHGNICGEQIKENFDKAISKKKDSCLSILIKKRKEKLIYDIIELKKIQNPKKNFNNLEINLNKYTKDILAKYLIGLNRVYIPYDKDLKQEDNDEMIDYADLLRPVLPCSRQTPCAYWFDLI